MLTFGEFVLAGWPAMLMWAPCSNGSCSRNLWQRRQFRCLFHHHLRTHHVLHHTWCWSVTSFSITRFSFLWFLANIPTPLLSNGLKRRGIDDHIARNLSRRSCQLCQGTKGNKDNLHDCCLAAKLLLWDLKWLWLNGALCHSIYTRLSSLSFFLKLKLTACLCILALWLTVTIPTRFDEQELQKLSLLSRHTDLLLSCLLSPSGWHPLNGALEDSNYILVTRSQRSKPTGMAEAGVTCDVNASVWS